MGMVVPVVITYFTDKSFEFALKTPPAAIMLLEASKVKTGSAEPNRKKIGTVTWEQVQTIAETKMPDLNCFTVHSAMKMIAGTAQNMGITITGNAPF
jgi:large subunit ribosomal protein L11